MLVRSVLSVILYVGLFNLYIALLTASTHYAHLLYNYLTLSAGLFFYFNQFGKCDKSNHVNSILGMCMVCNFIMIILHWHGLISAPRIMFYTFNGLVFVVGTIFYINMKRHGYFKRKYENDKS